MGLGQLKYINSNKCFKMKCFENFATVNFHIIFESNI